MQYYNATVRLAGSTMNEVQKTLSAPEILVLQYIHGVDAVAHVQPVRHKQVSLRQEKDRLRGLYDQALVKREQSIDTIFGPLGSVPERLPEDLIERFGIVDEDDVIEVAKTITSSEKRSKDPRATLSQAEEENYTKEVSTEEFDLDDLAE